MNYVTLENALEYWPPDALALPRTWAVSGAPVFVGTAEEAKAWLHEQFGEPDDTRAWGRWGETGRPELTAEDLTLCDD